MQLKSLIAGIALSLLSLFAWATEMVNINTADAVTLARTLLGVGPNKAAAIVNYRDTNGPFATVDSLSRVQGIGQRTVDINRERITVD